MVLASRFRQRGCFFSGEMLRDTINMFAGRRECDAMVGAGDQLEIEARFENVHLTHDRRWRDIERVRCFGKAAGFGDFEKDLELLAEHRISSWHLNLLNASYHLWSFRVKEGMRRIETVRTK